MLEIIIVAIECFPILFPVFIEYIGSLAGWASFHQIIEGISLSNLTLFVWWLWRLNLDLTKLFLAISDLVYQIAL